MKIMETVVSTVGRSSRTPRFRKKSPKVKSLLRKRKRTRQGSISALKAKLDAVFSIYVRTKYPKFCYTCDKPSSKLQCGHFIPRSYLATRWDERNTRPQCVGCNIWGRGQLLEFEERLIEELGREVVDELKAKRKLLWKLTPSWYEAEIKRYTGLVENLLDKP